MWMVIQPSAISKWMRYQRENNVAIGLNTSDRKVSVSAETDTECSVIFSYSAKTYGAVLS